jgi:hypothetical protein
VKLEIAMAFGKTPEERAREKADKAVEEAKRDAAKAIDRDEREKKQRHQQWLNTPLGQAHTAKEEGLGFFEIELELGSSKRTVAFATADFGSKATKSFTGLLSQIEDAGWRLEHVGYYFMITGETSRDKLLASGQNVAVSGKTIGIYLFRNTDRV